MARLLLLVAALFAVVALLRVLTKLRNKTGAAQTPPDAEAKTPAAATDSNTAHTKVQSLLPCPHCGVHMAGSELAEHHSTHHAGL